jgi:hypothetical protein
MEYYQCSRGFRMVISKKKSHARGSTLRMVAGEEVV